MRVLVVLIALAWALDSAMAQTSPHGPIRYACEACHTTESWRMRPDTSFKHETTGFRLIGQHTTLQCVRCHRALKFAGTPQACASCHTDVHRSELGVNCLRCHTTQSWKITDMLQQHQQTRFPLLGKHAAVDCQACHAQMARQQYRGTPTACIGCHRTDYQGTQNPPHTAAGFSTECAQCHRVNAFVWSAGFDHSLTGFPLTGAHRAVACNICHQQGRFTSTPRDCFICHQAQFASTTNPSHAMPGFSITCQQCHTTAAWSPATFDHQTTRFPLTGRHTTTQCQSCHVGGNYRLTYVNCYQCHQADFQRPTSPNHVTAGFSPNCETCHTTSAWKPSTFDHDGRYFRIYSGEHRGKWTTCSTCHPNSASYVEFTCISCHEHDQSRMADKHRGVNGYVYASPACYSCHRGV